MSGGVVVFFAWWLMEEFDLLLKEHHAGGVCKSRQGEFLQFTCCCFSLKPVKLWQHKYNVESLYFVSTIPFQSLGYVFFS